MESDPAKIFQQEVADNIDGLRRDPAFRDLSMRWMRDSLPHRYSYNFSWMGRPIIQYPQDMLAMQEIIWRVRPQLILETGVAHGGSLVFYASLLELIGEGRVLGIDIDIRAHNRAAIEGHPMSHRISLIQGSSIDPAVVARVSGHATGIERVLVVLDSNHTHDHVLEELRAYAPMVSPGSYCVVMDTTVEDMPASAFANRPWGPGDNPKTAVRAYLKENPDFQVDAALEAKLMITVASEGYLQRIA